MNEEFMQFLQTLAPEQRQQLMGQMGQQGGGGLPEIPPAPGMAPAPGAAPQQAPQQVDPKMGMPGMFEDFQGQAGIIDDQQAQAEKLRGGSTPQGINTGAGFVASNPMSHIAKGVNDIRGGMAAREALQAKKDLSEKITSTQQNAAKNILETDKQKQMAQELRNNRRGGTVMDVMAANQGVRGSA
jgi:hypothetical protein